MKPKKKSAVVQHSERHRGRYRKTSADPPAISWPLARLAPASGQDVQLLPPLSGLPPPLRAVSLDRLLSGPRESQGPIALSACQHAHQVAAAADEGGESVLFKHPPSGQRVDKFKLFYSSASCWRLDETRIVSDSRLIWFVAAGAAGLHGSPLARPPI